MTTVDDEQFISECRSFFDKVKHSITENDPLPVKVGGYSINNHEVDGEVVDWSLQYLQTRNCPTRLLPHLISEVMQNVRTLLSAATAKELIEESSDKGFPPIRLMHLVIDELKKVCLKYQDNQHFEKLSLDLGKSCRPQLNPVSVFAIKNTRRKMEDRHVILQDMNAFCNLTDQVPCSYFAVFDGHAGTDAAFYAASQLYQYLVKNPNFLTNTTLALKEAFVQTDVTFIRKNKFENLKGGTTAVVALISGNNLSVAWLGDSQAILVKEGLVTSLVDPHKPDRADEKERIAQLGGEIVFWDGAYRVNGQLAVSRAIGDASYKPYVTAEPDVVSVTLDGGEDFLILACDGLWDTVGLKEAAFLVHQHLHHSPDDLSGVSTRLVQAAKQKGSSDNISVIVVFFRDPAELAVRPLPAAPETPPELPLSPAAMEEQQQQQQRELEHLAAKWGWGQSAGAVLFGEAPWQQQEAQQQQQENNVPSAAAEHTNGVKSSPLNPEAPEFSWNPAAGIQGDDWNQYDEELSGRPSLMGWEQKEQETDSNCRDAETGETTLEVALQQHEEAAPRVVDEVDRSEVLSGNTEEPLLKEEACDNPSDQSDVKESAPFNWNLSAPEFEFTAVPDQQTAASDDFLEEPSCQPRKLSAAEVLAKSANDAELAILLAAASDDPDEEENSEAADPDLEASPKLSNAEAQTLMHQDSRGDTTLEEAVDSEEDDWTYYSGEKGEEGKQKMEDNEVYTPHEAVLSPPEGQTDAGFFASTPAVNDATASKDPIESPVLNASSSEGASVVEVETITTHVQESVHAETDLGGQTETAAFETIELNTTVVSVVADVSHEAVQDEVSVAKEDHIEETRQGLEDLALTEQDPAGERTAEVAATDVPVPDEVSEAAPQPPAGECDEAGIAAKEAAPAANFPPEVAGECVNGESVGDAVRSAPETVTQEEAAATTETAPQVDRNDGLVAEAAAAEPEILPTVTEELPAAAEPPAEDTNSLISDTGATIGSEKAAAVAGTIAAAASVGAAAVVAASRAVKRSPIKKLSGAAALPPKTTTTAAAKKPEVKVTKIAAKPAPKPAASVTKAAPKPAAVSPAAAAKKAAPVGRAAAPTVTRVATAAKSGSSSAASSPTKPASPAKPTSAAAALPRRPVGAAAPASGVASRTTTSAASASGPTSRASASASAASSKTPAKPALTNGEAKNPIARPGVSRPTSSTATAAATTKPSMSTSKTAAAPSLAKKAPASTPSARPAPSAAKKAPPSSTAAAPKPAQPNSAVKKPAIKPAPQ